MIQNENEQLLDHVRELRDENGRLHKLLSEKDFEIKHLKKKREEDRLALAGTAGLAGDAAATKIVELSKKTRDLASEVEREKTKTKQANNRVRELEKELQAMLLLNPGKTTNKKQASKIVDDHPENNPVVKSLQEKLSVAQLKMAEYRNQIQQHSSLIQQLKLMVAEMENKNYERWKSRIPEFIRSGHSGTLSCRTDERTRPAKVQETKDSDKERSGCKKTVTLAPVSRYMTDKSLYTMRKPLISTQYQMPILKNSLTHEDSERISYKADTSKEKNKGLPTQPFRSIKEVSPCYKSSPPLSKDDLDSSMNMSDLKGWSCDEDTIFNTSADQSAARQGRGGQASVCRSGAETASGMAAFSLTRAAAGESQTGRQKRSKPDANISSQQNGKLRQYSESPGETGGIVSQKPL
nr:Zgc:158627 [Danio rerio]